MPFDNLLGSLGIWHLSAGIVQPRLCLHDLLGDTAGAGVVVVVVVVVVLTYFLAWVLFLL